MVGGTQGGRPSVGVTSAVGRYTAAHVLHGVR
jgi:hypothetical protein